MQAHKSQEFYKVAQNMEALGEVLKISLNEGHGDLETETVNKRLKVAQEFAVCASKAIKKNCSGMGGAGSAYSARRRSTAKSQELRSLHQTPNALKNIENYNLEHSNDVTSGKKSNMVLRGHENLNFGVNNTSRGKQIVDSNEDFSMRSGPPKKQKTEVDDMSPTMVKNTPRGKQ